MLSQLLLFVCTIKIRVTWQSYSVYEYTNENYTILEMTNRTGNNFISKSDASDYCVNTFGSNLASFHSDSDSNSYLTLANLHKLNTTGVWIGAYDTTATDTSLETGWIWDDGTSWSYTRWQTGQPDKGVQQCAYWRFDEFGTWGDIPCSGQVTTGVYCPAFVCNTISIREYNISILTGSDTMAGTVSTIWFKIQGSIEMTNDDSETWTEWFSTNLLTEYATTYKWNERLTNVGQPINLIILNKQSDFLKLKEVTIDSQTYNFGTSDVRIEYDYSSNGNGCSYIIINFSNNSITDHTETYNKQNVSCPYLTELPTREPTPQPTNQPSIPPTSQTSTPTILPTSSTRDPTLQPTIHPTSQTPIPTISPTVQSNPPIPIPTEVPTSLSPTQQPSHQPSQQPTSDSNSGDSSNSSNTSLIDNNNMVVYIMGAVSLVVIIVLVIIIIILLKRRKQTPNTNPTPQTKRGHQRTASSSVIKNNHDITDLTPGTPKTPPGFVNLAATSYQRNNDKNNNVSNYTSPNIELQKQHNNSDRIVAINIATQQSNTTSGYVNYSEQTPAGGTNYNVSNNNLNSTVNIVVQPMHNNMSNGNNNFQNDDDSDDSVSDLYHGTGGANDTIGRAETRGEGM